MMVKGEGQRATRKPDSQDLCSMTKAERQNSSFRLGPTNSTGNVDETRILKESIEQSILSKANIG